MAKGKQLVVCVHNEDPEASLEMQKAYVALRDLTAEKHDLLRIIDEPGDDYLHPKAFFDRLRYRKQTGGR